MAAGGPFPTPQSLKRPLGSQVQPPHILSYLAEYRLESLPCFQKFHCCSTLTSVTFHSGRSSELPGQAVYPNFESENVITVAQEPPDLSPRGCLGLQTQGHRQGHTVQVRT